MHWNCYLTENFAPALPRPCLLCLHQSLKRLTLVGYRYKVHGRPQEECLEWSRPWIGRWSDGQWNACIMKGRASANSKRWPRERYSRLVPSVHSVITTFSSTGNGFLTSSFHFKSKEYRNRNIDLAIPKFRLHSSLSQDMNGRKKAWLLCLTHIVLICQTSVYMS